MRKIVIVMFVILSLLLFALTSYAPAQGRTPAPDFVINCADNTLSAPAGTRVTFELSLTPVNDFDGTAEITCATAGVGTVACDVLPSSVIFGDALGEGRFTVTATANSRAALGTYSIEVTVKGTHGEPSLASKSVSHSKMLYVTVSKTP
jgi:hypothetical protein